LHQGDEIPLFFKLYEVGYCLFVQRLVAHDAQVFINLEKEIEDSLPQFQELLLSLRCVTLCQVHIAWLNVTSQS
jgi:hypothetical protein